MPPNCIVPTTNCNYAFFPVNTTNFIYRNPLKTLQTLQLLPQKRIHLILLFKVAN